MLRFLCRYSSLAGAAYRIRILCEYSALEAWFRLLYFLQTLCDLFRRNFKPQLALINVEGDGVAFVHGCDGPSQLGLGGYVADHQAACSSGEAAVGEKRDGLG